MDRGLAIGDLDAVVTIVNNRDLGGGFFETPLFASAFVVIARAGNPGVKPVLTAEAYAALEHVIVTAEPDARGVIDATLEALGLSRRVAVRVPRSTLVPPLIASTDLVAAVDAPALTPYRDSLPLQTIEVEGLDLPEGQ